MKRWKSLTAAFCAAVLLCGFSAVPAYAFADSGEGADYGDPSMTEETTAPSPYVTWACYDDDKGRRCLLYTSMAASKSQKIQAEIEKVKAKINEQQARLKELEKNKLEAENSEIVDIVRGLSISLEELPLVLQQLREGTSGQSVQKSGPAEKEENGI